MYFRVFSLKDLIMKKIVALALVAVALCAVGCGDKPKPTGGAGGTTTTSPTK
jgi:hypothetical protein